MILIRKAVEGDGAGIATTYNEGLKRGFNAYTGAIAPFNATRVLRFNKRFSSEINHEASYVAIDSETGKNVGSCMFSGREFGKKRHDVELAWGVHPDYARKGIATRMVSILIKEAKRRGFRRIEAEAARENISSFALAKKLGFTMERRKRSGIMLNDGTFIDTYVFGKAL